MDPVQRQGGLRRQRAGADGIFKRNPGHDSVVIYLKDVNAMKRLPAAFHVKISDSWMEGLRKKYGESNVKVVQRVLKNF